MSQDEVDEEMAKRVIQHQYPKLADYRLFSAECVVTKTDSKQEKNPAGANVIVNYVEFDGPYLDPKGKWITAGRSGLISGRQGSSTVQQKDDRFFW